MRARQSLIPAIGDKPSFIVLCGMLFAIALAAIAGGCRSGGERMAIPHLVLTMPSGWRQAPPTSAMRVGEATVPGPGGDAQMVVYYFGTGQGGDIESNLQRWMNQVIPAEGTSLHRETFDGDGVRVTWIDVEGTIKPGEMGMGPAAAQPDSRLLGAVIEGERGPWFIKLTGPQATVAAQRDAFLAMLRSATPTA